MNQSTSHNSTHLSQLQKKNKELLLKGVFIGLIGLGVLLSPSFMAPSSLRDTISSSYLVGWFAVLLGGVFISQYLARKMNR